MLSSSLSIHLFGPLRVLIDDQPMPRVRTRTVEYLLALLALRQDRAVNRSWLAGTLWPDSEESQALQNLRTALVHLRKALGAEAERIQSPTRDTLTLDLEGAEVDVVTFDRALQAGDDVSLGRAVEVYTGPLLEGCYEEWALSERATRTEQCRTALETLAERAQERGEMDAAVRFLRQAEAIDPLRETTLRRLMTCLAASGDAAAAGEVYRRFRQRLHGEMAAAPDRETILLYQQIRAHAQQTARPAAQTPDLAPGALSHSEPPAPAASPVRPPHPLAPLIGREQAVETVRERLRQHRLVTLTGAGGVGKTRLALEAAGRAGQDFAGGAVWVELAPLTEGALILPTLSEALGLRSEGTGDAGTLLNQAVRRLSEGTCLLVLDNCEHLLDAAAQLLQPLLSRCPDLRVLATSRQRLGLTGEMVWRVPSLSVPDEGQLPADPEAARAFPAIQLFVERASSVRSGFRLAHREDLEAVCRICRRLDGIPLALELAAARANILTVSQIAARLDDRFRLLTGGSRAAAPRHQTLQALIDWSYEQLSEPERALLRRLSVFSGGWSLEAAEAVCAEVQGVGSREWGVGKAYAEGATLDSKVPQAPETYSLLPTPYSLPVAPQAQNLLPTPYSLFPSAVLDLLASLEDKSLVLVEEHTDGLRYRMLETVREYGREQLRASGEARAVRERHADHYLTLAEQAQPFLAKSEPAWLDRLEVEHDNLRAALTCFAAPETTVEKAVRLAAALGAFWNTRGHVYEQRTWLIGLARRPTAPTEARAHLLSNAGWIAAQDQEFAAARQMFNERLEIWRQLGNRWGIADTLIGIAGLISDPSLAGSDYDSDTARSLAEESLAMMRELGYRQGIGQCCYFLGRLARQAGDEDRARAFWLECRALDEALGVKGGHVIPMLGELALESGDPAEARRYFEAYLIECRQTGNRYGIAWGLRGLSMVAFLAGEPEHSARLSGASEVLHESVGGFLSQEAAVQQEALRSALRERLGASAFDAAWAEGSAMTPEQATAYALDRNRL